jgi:hypothetical protein
MTQQHASSARHRNIDQHWTDVLTDPDFQCVCLVALIGILIVACLTSAFPLDDNAISSIALLS